MNIYKEINEKIIYDEWIESKAKGRGGVGITLESLLGKETENFEIPDYKGIELKTKCSKIEKDITLFSSIPDSYLFEIKRLNEKYGKADKECPQFNTFNLAIYGNRKVKYNQNYFKLYVDYNKKQVFLKVYDLNNNIIDSDAAWSFDLLKEKLERKLKCMALIHADRKFAHNTVYFKYKDIAFYNLISFDRFLVLLTKGIIKVTFRIGFYKNDKKFGQVYDHGTSFSINENNLEKLFKKVELCDQGE